MEGSRERYELRTLGTLGVDRVTSAGERRACLGVGKPVALLAYLSMTHERSASRDECIELLWANLESARARLSLRQALFQLRATLGPTSIVSDGDRIRLEAPLGVDAIAFRAAAEEGRDSALELYRGPFARDASFPGGAGWEEWAARERFRLEALLLKCAEASVERHLRQGSRHVATRSARLLRAVLPERSASGRLLLETLLQCGELGQAMLEADAIESALREEGVEAEPALADSLRRVRQLKSPRAVSGDDPRPEFVGREYEFGELLRIYRGAMGGRSRHVHVSAPAGFGKTRLVEEFGDRLRAIRGRLVHVSAVPSDAWLSHALLARVAEALGGLRGAKGVSPASTEVLVGLAPSLSAHFDRLTPIAARHDELQRTQAVRELLAAAAEERTVVLAIDDLHWSDRDSITALQRLADTLPGNVLLLTTSRPPTALHSLATAACFELAPLTTEQVAAIVASYGLDLSSADGSSAIETLAHAANGSPLLVMQLLRAAMDLTVVQRDGDSLRVRSMGELADTFRSHDPIDARVRALSASERVLLEWMAIAGRPLAPAFIGRLNGSDVSDDLLRLASRGLVSRVGDNWTAAHHLIGEAVLRAMPAERGRELHALLGAALADAARSAGDVRAAAHHLTCAADDRALLALARRYVREQREQGRRDAWLTLAREGIGATGTERILPELRRAVPWRERRVIRTLASGAVLLLAAIGASVAQRRVRVQRAIVVQEPLQSKRHAERPHVLMFEPPLSVEFRDAEGQRLANVEDTVWIITSDSVSHRSDTTRQAVRDGVATFSEVVHRPAASLSARIVTVRGGSASTLRIPHRASSESALRLRAFHVGDVVLRAGDSALVVPPSTFVTGMLQVEYDAYWTDETVFYAATPTWGRARDAVLSLGVLSTPARGRVRSDSVAFTTPRIAGTYYMILVAGPETNAAFLMSGTNWVMRTPSWDDGNDVAAWSPAQVESAMREGRGTISVDRAAHGTRSRATQVVPATAFRLVVDPAVAAPTVR